MLAVMCEPGECCDKLFKTFIGGVFLYIYIGKKKPKPSLIQADIGSWQTPALQLSSGAARGIFGKPRKIWVKYIAIMCKLYITRQYLSVCCHIRH